MWGRIIIVDFYLDAKEKEKNLNLLLKGCYFLSNSKSIPRNFKWLVMGRTPFYRTSNKLEHHFSNIEQTRTCSSIDTRTRIPYFWLWTIEHRTSNDEHRPITNNLSVWLRTISTQTYPSMAKTCQGRKYPLSTNHLFARPIEHWQPSSGGFLS